MDWQIAPIKDVYFCLFVGGADLGYIRNLSSDNVSMSLSTFINLDTNVISVSKNFSFDSFMSSS